MGQPVPFTPLDSLKECAARGHLALANAIKILSTLWKVQTGRPVGNPMIGLTGMVFSLAFTADGNHIVSNGEDGWVLWPGPGSWRHVLCNKLTITMTPGEWDEWVSPDIEYRAALPRAGRARVIR
jgi:hypothetical protein